MQNNENEVLRSYFDSLQMDLIIANYSDRVSSRWGRPESKDDYHRFYLIMEGEGWIKIGQQELFPSPGQLLLLPADIPLTYSTISENTFSKHWVHFSAKIGGFHLTKLITFPFSVEVADMAYTENLFNQLRTASQSYGSMNTPLRTRALLMEILSCYIDNAPPQSIQLSNSSSSNQSNLILKYIDDHMAEALTLDELANAFHYNPNYFIRYFKALFNMSPNQYIRKARIENAKRLLIHSNLSIEEIAAQVGLEKFYFSKIFKQFTSMSPSQFRQMIRSKGR